MYYQRFSFDPFADNRSARRDPSYNPRDFSIPEGFPVFFDVDGAALHLPSLLFLADKAALPIWERGGDWAEDTVKTYADDIKPLMDFCSELGLADDEIDDDHGYEYAEHLLDRRIADTGEALAVNTRLQRLNRAGAMLADARIRGLVDCDWDMPALRAVVSAYGADALGASGPRDAKRRHRSFMLVEEYESICGKLGPLPSERAEGDDRSCRPRLSSEIAAGTGTRAAETACLDVAHFTGCDIPDGEGWLPVHITDTKRKVPRDISVPFATAREVRSYIELDREAAYQAGCGRADFVRSSRLFLNEESAIRGRGNAVTASTLSDDFRRAVIAAGYFLELEVVGRDGPRTIKVPMFHFHSLRHSFAMWLYALMAVEEHDPEQGLRAEPWVRVAARLGHQDPETTQRYYVSLSGALEVQVAELVYGARRAMIHA